MGIAYNPAKPITDSEFEFDAALLRDLDRFRKRYHEASGHRIGRADAIKMLLSFMLKHHNLVDEIVDEVHGQ